MSETDRKTILLKATLDLLKKCDEGPFVENPLVMTVFYDGTDCDGSCLMEDIERELTYGDTRPVPAGVEELVEALRKLLPIADGSEPCVGSAYSLALDLARTALATYDAQQRENDRG